MSITAQNNGMKPVKIFISHSSKDEDYMWAFTNLLDRIHIPEDCIICSSIPDYRIKTGEKIYEWLRSQFMNYNLHMIFVLSENYYKSVASLNEMGAAWLTASKYDLLLLPGFRFEDIKGCVDATKLGISLDANEDELKARLEDLRDSLYGDFELTPIGSTKWERIRDEFITRIREVKNNKRDSEESDRKKEDQNIIQKAIELGREKVRRGYVSDLIDEVSEKALEICGMTEADYYGTDEIKYLKGRYDKENDYYKMKFYKYFNRSLQECSFVEALSTPEYMNENVLIFSQMEDEKRMYYVTDIINQ